MVKPLSSILQNESELERGRASFSQEPQAQLIASHTDTRVK